MPLWKETDPNYLTDNADLGKAYMQSVRKRVKYLNLKGSSVQEE